MTLAEIIDALDGAGLVITDPAAIEAELERLGYDKEVYVRSREDAELEGEQE